MTFYFISSQFNCILYKMYNKTYGTYGNVVENYLRPQFIIILNFYFTIGDFIL